MPRGTFSHNYDPDRLRRLIQEGKTAREIMKEMKISKYTLHEQVLMLQRRDKQIYEIPGLLEAPCPEISKWKRYKKQGVIFSEKMLEASGFKPGTAFEMIVEEDRIILKKIDSNG
ncbi:AbrB/MazE/SpoVT family DNA-binding domain-containing protein [Desulfohalobium retbaense]|uniref:Uncharacterized protein n=1 Tax=Desulfohalobium retbaense (strain ATCC 49708 / DSM 5692 / JCM 16813 / HR100) TaxID=485915 RepID=C8X219_DESRD|nr:AbrB/MazE/SpoVT family DNA-binding domain-containing protein [Desulfohalobium retbaense]ACV68342.1 conserved hypothetical protein [Desulfohalobium retbaense DSM 5692]